MISNKFLMSCLFFLIVNIYSGYNIFFYLKLSPLNLIKLQSDHDCTYHAIFSIIIIIVLLSILCLVTLTEY